MRTFRSSGIAVRRQLAARAAVLTAAVLTLGIAFATSAQAQTLGISLPLPDGATMLPAQCDPNNPNTDPPTSVGVQTDGQLVAAPQDGVISGLTMQVGEVLDCSDDGSGHAKNTPAAKFPVQLQVYHQTSPGVFEIRSRSEVIELAANQLNRISVPPITVSQGDTLGLYAVDGSLNPTVIWIAGFDGVTGGDLFISNGVRAVGDSINDFMSLGSNIPGAEPQVGINFQFELPTQPVPQNDPTPQPAVQTLSISSVTTSLRCARYNSSSVEQLGFNLNRSAKTTVSIERIVGAKQPSTRCPRPGQRHRAGRSNLSTRTQYASTSDLNSGTNKVQISLRKAGIARRPGFYRIFIQSESGGQKARVFAGNLRIASQSR